MTSAGLANRDLWPVPSRDQSDLGPGTLWHPRPSRSPYGPRGRGRRPLRGDESAARAYAVSREAVLVDPATKAALAVVRTLPQLGRGYGRLAGVTRRGGRP